MKFLRFIAIFFAFGAAALGAGFFWVRALMDEPATDEEIILKIPKNYSLSRTIDLIQSRGALQPDKPFDLIVKAYAKINKAYVQAGTYKFPAKITNQELMNSIFYGRNQFTINVTYPEGRTIPDFARISAEKIGLDESEFMRIMTSDSLIEALEIPIDNAEGYLMPETYKFFWKEEPSVVIARLLDLRRKLWDENCAAKADSIGTTMHEALTLASIIEAETAVADERRRIAGVYANRLTREIPLQADPTVQYSLPKRKERLTYADLKIGGAYNTYKNAGLPPGPINSPGLGAMIAAVDPEEHNYYYFVAKGDGSGEHFFGRNSYEHSANKRQYKLNLRKRN